MDDAKIIELFWHRSEEATSELSRKYGAVLSRIAENITDSKRDAEECVNDAYLARWNTIPPESPQQLLSYACRIVRNISVSRKRKNMAVKRWGNKDTLKSRMARRLSRSVAYMLKPAAPLLSSPRKRTL